MLQSVPHPESAHSATRGIEHLEDYRSSAVGTISSCVEGRDAGLGSFKPVSSQPFPNSLHIARQVIEIMELKQRFARSIIGSTHNRAARQAVEISPLPSDISIFPCCSIDLIAAGFTCALGSTFGDTIAKVETIEARNEQMRFWLRLTVE